MEPFTEDEMTKLDREAARCDAVIAVVWRLAATALLAYAVLCNGAWLLWAVVPTLVCLWGVYFTGRYVGDE